LSHDYASEQVGVDVVFISFMLRVCNSGNEMYNGISGIDITWRLSLMADWTQKLKLHHLQMLVALGSKAISRRWRK
jgi:hypothetical protein